MKQFQIFSAFFKVGLLGYGGGPSSIPLFHKEVVDHYKWMDNDEFSDLLALANALPGPIATKLAGYIGYRVSGVIGMLNGIFAVMIPTIFLMIFLLTTLSSFKDQPWVQGMTKAVVPVVGVMLAVLTWQFLMHAKKGLGWNGTAILGIGTLLSIQLFNVHPGIIIAVLLIAALTMKDKVKKEEGDSSS